VHMDFSSRRITAHFKTADRNGARWALIAGDEELSAATIVLRDLEARTEERLRVDGDAMAVAGSIAAAVEGKELAARPAEGARSGAKRR